MFDAVHRLVAYLPLVAELDQGHALRPEQLPHQALEGGGAFLQPATVATVEAGAEAATTVVVDPAQPLGRVLLYPVFFEEFLYACQRGLCNLDPADYLLPFLAAVVYEPESADQRRLCRGGLIS